MAELVDPEVPDIARRQERLANRKLYQNLPAVRNTYRIVQSAWLLAVITILTLMLSRLAEISWLWLMALMCWASIGEAVRSAHIYILRRHDRRRLAVARQSGRILTVPDWAISIWNEAVEQTGLPPDCEQLQPAAQYRVFAELEVDFRALNDLKAQIRAAQEADETYKEPANSPRRLLEAEVKQHLRDVVADIARHIQQAEADHRLALDAQRELADASAQDLINRPRWRPTQF